MDATVVARAILRGVKAATSSTSLNFLREIHLVLLKIDVFLAFKREAMQMFPTAIKNTGAQAFTTITHTKCVPSLIKNSFMPLVTHSFLVT